jgi:hypothetical protein
MDGTGKNVKVKRKANKLQKGGGYKWRREWRSQLIRASASHLRENQLRRGGCSTEQKPVSVARKALCNASRDRHLELFVLVRLHHEQDPEN